MKEYSYNRINILISLWILILYVEGSNYECTEAKNGKIKKDISFKLIHFSMCKLMPHCNTELITHY